MALDFFSSEQQELIFIYKKIIDYIVKEKWPETDYDFCFLGKLTPTLVKRIEVLLFWQIKGKPASAQEKENRMISSLY